ncbi:MAG: GGDEF domain-containing protein [Lachnospiraceae bacterium]|nr:GGDEF domain-containing protein [Lachnospiraceae bacterium]
MKQITVEYKDCSNLDEQLNEIKKEFTEGSYKKILFHVYSGILDEKLVLDITKKINSAFDTDMIVGSISAGEIKEGRLMDRGVLISAMLFESADIQVLRFEKSIGNEREIGKNICELIDGIEDIKAAELMLPGTNLNTRVLFEELSKCNPDVQIFGGYAGGHAMETNEHYVFDHNGLYDQMVFVVTYAGADFHISIDKSVGWQTLGMPFKVTKADDNRLIEVNHRPAVELYEKYMQIEADDNFAEETFEFPLMAEVDGEELLRHTILVEEDGTLLLAGYVTEGMDIYLCYGAPADIVKKVDVRLKTVCEFQPEAVLLYSCSVRKSFWEDFVDIEMMPFQKVAETAGFHTWGEVSRDLATGSVLEYNITLLSIAMREGEPAQIKPEIVCVDDSVLKGQASLIKRLTKLVSATTTELQKAYNDLSDMNDMLVKMAEHDGLTGIYNRRKIEQIINAEFEKSQKNNDTTSLVMLDIDHFKQVNDVYGHEVGDVTLKLVSNLMSDAIARIDGGAVGRWGGEEFMMLLPKTSLKDAEAFAENLRKCVEFYSFEAVGHLTVSMGVASADNDDEIKNIYTRVDDALYKAKNSGRNRVVTA